MAVFVMVLVLAVLSSVALIAVLLGAHAIWQFGSSNARRAASTVGGFVTAAYLLSPGPAMAQSFDVDVDLSSFFDSMNAFLPTMLAIFGLIGGIIGAIALAQMVIDKVVAAFR